MRGLVGRQIEVKNPVYAVLWDFTLWRLPTRGKKQFAFLGKYFAYKQPLEAAKKLRMAFNVGIPAFALKSGRTL